MVKVAFAEEMEQFFCNSLLILSCLHVLSFPFTGRFGRANSRQWERTSEQYDYNSHGLLSSIQTRMGNTKYSFGNNRLVSLIRKAWIRMRLYYIGTLFCLWAKSYSVIIRWKRIKNDYYGSAMKYLDVTASNFLFNHWLFFFLFVAGDNHFAFRSYLEV